MTQAQQKAFGYLRVSGKGQVEGDGFPRQKATITKWAAANGIKIVRWFEEEGVSGSLLERPALSAMMVELMSDGVHLVIVEKLDRIARDQLVQETIIQSLLKQGFKLASATPGEENLCGNDPGRKLMRQIMGAIAEYDKVMIVAKLKAARQRKRAAQGWCEKGGVYGVQPGEADVVERIKQMAAQDLNCAAIAHALNSSSVKPRSGKQWYDCSVRNVLRRALQAR